MTEMPMARALRPNHPETILRMIMHEKVIALDATFHDLVARAAAAHDEYPLLSNSYIRLALRAHSNCRRWIEMMMRAERVAAREAQGDAA